VDYKCNPVHLRLKPVLSISARDTAHPYRGDSFDDTCLAPGAGNGLPRGWAPSCRRAEGGGTRPSPHPRVRWAQGRSHEGGTTSRVPQRSSYRSRDPIAGGAAAGPPGPRARRTLRWARCLDIFDQILKRCCNLTVSPGLRAGAF
jgi:hypothetical protein